VQASNGTWLQRLTLDDEVLATWGDPAIAWRGTEHEAKAVSELIPLDESHPLRVRPISGGSTS